MTATSARRVPVWTSMLVEQKGMNMPTLERGQVYLFQLAKGDSFYTLERDSDPWVRGKIRRDFQIDEVLDDGDTYIVSEIDLDKIVIRDEIVLNNLEVVYPN